MDRPPSFASLLQHYREERHLSHHVLVDQLTKRINHAQIDETIDERTIRRWEEGTHRPGPAKWNNLKPFIQQVLKLSDEQIDQLTRLIVNSSSSLAALYQLQLPVLDFVGRKAEIDTIMQLVKQKPAPPVIIQGMGGVGKTQLAYAVAKRAKKLFPDGQLRVDLGATRNKPSTPEEVLQQILHDVGFKGQLPESRTQLENLYQNYLKNRRILILADDAQYATQVRSLCPPAGSALIITTRHRFRIPGDTGPIELDVLSPSEAVSLIQQICPSLKTKAEDMRILVELCAHHPLALRICAETLSNDPSLQSTDYIERLSRARIESLSPEDDDRDDPQASLEASLKLSYIHLNELERTIFRQMSVFGLDFNETLIHNIVLKYHNASRDQLSSLVKRHLVNYSANNNCYRVHELVYLFALNILKQDEQEKASVQDRYIAWYSHFIEEADLAPSDHAVWLDRVQNEHQHILQALNWIKERNDNMIGLRMLAHLWRPWYKHNHMQIGFQWLKYFIEKTQSYNGPEKALALQGGGVFASRLGNHNEAEEFLKQSYELYQTLGNRRGMILAIDNMAMIKSQQGKYEDARSYIKQSIDLLPEANAEILRGVLLSNLADVTHSLGDLEESYALIQESIAILENNGDEYSLSVALNTKGDILTSQKRFEHALNSFKEALHLKRKIDDKEGFAWSCEGIAFIVAEHKVMNIAVTLLSFAQQLRQDIYGLIPPSREHIQEMIHSMKAQVNSDDWENQWAEGTLKKQDQIYDLAVSVHINSDSSYK